MYFITIKNTPDAELSSKSKIESYWDMVYIGSSDFGLYIRIHSVDDAASIARLEKNSGGVIPLQQKSRRERELLFSRVESFFFVLRRLTFSLYSCGVELLLTLSVSLFHRRPACARAWINLLLSNKVTATAQRAKTFIFAFSFLYTLCVYIYAYKLACVSAF